MPHNFGPFSAAVYQAVETLESAGLLSDSANLSASTEDSWESEELIDDLTSSRFTTRDFELTEKGRRYYNALLRELPKDTEQIVREIKDKFGALPLRQLIRYVYTRHEDYTGVSVIRDEILGK